MENNLQMILKFIALTPALKKSDEIQPCEGRSEVLCFAALTDNSIL